MKRLPKFAKEGYLTRKLKSPEAVARYEAILIGKKIKELRHDKKLTQQQLAKKLHTSQSALARIEHGKQNLSLGLLVAIASLLNKKIDIKFY